MQQLSLESFLYEQYKIPKNKKLRLISFFSGYDSQALGLKYANIPFEHYKTCEWAVNSIQALKDLHFGNDNFDYSANLSYNDILDYLYNKGISANYNEPMTFEQIKRKGEKWARNVYNNIHATKNLVNIQQVKGGDLEINECDKYEYLLTYSFPCITNDSLILTKNGYKQMKDVNVGELVLTKSNTWQKVAKKFDNGVHQTCFLNAMGFENIHCTLNHQFYVKTMYREWENNTRRYIRKFTEPKFKQTKDLTKNDYLGIPVINEEIEFYTDNLDFWFIVGMYLGDGWLSKNDNSILIACNNKKLDILSKKLDNFKWHKHKTRTCWKINIKNKNMREFLEKYIGTGSNFKRIPYEILALPKKYLKSFYEGYLSSDGCCIDNKRQFSSINRQLIYSISLIINKLFHRPTCIYKIKVKNKKIIENRIVNQKDWYQLRFNINNNKQDKAFYENGYIWYPFKKIELAEKENVYNMEIENDHSYIIQGCISKNCQDLSLAGVRKGMTKGSGTRSGMLWEVERILKECDTLPNILLMENVPQIHSQENKDDFILWQKELEKLGYRNYWEDLNAKDYLVPQNRNRTFMISILGDYFYEFPQKQKLVLRLKDLLESEVDEKYYISDKQIKDIQNWNAYEKPLETMEKVDKTNISPTLTTRTGAYAAGMILVKEHQEDILKKELCNKLIEEGKVQEGDIVNHSYTSQILEGNKKCVEKSDGVMITLTTRGDCVGVCVKEEEPKVIVKGNYSPSNHNASRIVDGNGIAPTVMENHGTITAIVENGGVMNPETTQKGMIQTLKTQCNDIGVVVVNDNNIYNLFFNIFDLCCAIDTKEKDKYERSRELLQILWQEIGKKEIWQEIRRFIGVQEKKILQSNLYENGIYEDRKLQSRISSSPSNSEKHNGSITNREKMFNMWKEWKNRYTPQRWELSKQQFRQFNLFMQELSYETTQGETSMQDMWQTNERFRVLQQTLFEIQEIWRPIENKISNGLRIRKLSPLECWRLMGVKDEDFNLVKNNQSESSLYHLGGDSIVVNVLSEIFKKLI